MVSAILLDKHRTLVVLYKPIRQMPILPATIGSDRTTSSVDDSAALKGFICCASER
jgi:hypothetical protein